MSRSIDRRDFLFTAAATAYLGMSPDKALGGAPVAPDPNFHVYLAFGQSNMEGLRFTLGVVNVAVAGCKIELFDKDAYESYAATAPAWMTNIIKEYGNDQKLPS